MEVFSSKLLDYPLSKEIRVSQTIPKKSRSQQTVAEKPPSRPKSNLAPKRENCTKPEAHTNPTNCQETADTSKPQQG